MDNKLLNVKSFKTLYSALLMKFKSMIKKSDWNQNDKNADDYIKNRTHYTEMVNGVEVVHKLDEKYLPELELGVKSWNDLEDKPFCDETETIVYLATTTLEASDFEESNEYRYQNAKYHYTGLFDTNTIEVGKTYIVNWDGVEYETQCKQWEYSNYLGMRYDDYNDGESYSEYPFGFRLVRTNVSALKSNTINVVMAKEAGSHTFSIYEKFEEIHKLDEKFIPDTIAKTEDLSEIDVLKMNKENPSGTGSFSMNRKAGSTVGGLSFAEGYNTVASGNNSHAEGNDTTASGEISHAEGLKTSAFGSNSHAEGFRSIARGENSHAEGYYTIANGYCSHTEGYQTAANEDYSHAEGLSTKAASPIQHVQGSYNIEDADSKYVHIVGNGTSDTERSNAHTLDWEGNAWYAGSVEGASIILSSPNGTRFSITVGDDGVLSATEITE